MAGGPEIQREVPQVQERREEFIVDETLKNTGVTTVQKNFKAQVRDDKGSPVIQTTPTQVIAVTLPASQTTLTSWSKGPVTSSLTWLAVFWLRVLKRAIHFGWKITGDDSKSN